MSRRWRTCLRCGRISLQHGFKTALCKKPVYTAVEVVAAEVVNIERPMRKGNKVIVIQSVFGAKAYPNFNDYCQKVANVPSR